MFGKVPCKCFSEEKYCYNLYMPCVVIKDFKVTGKFIVRQQCDEKVVRILDFHAVVPGSQFKALSDYWLDLLSVTGRSQRPGRKK